MDHNPHIEANRLNWNDRTNIHADSPGYNLQAYLDPDHLSDTVRTDRDVLGDLSGLDAVHLQCHLGTDTLSLARLGARVAGVDLSERSVEVAQQLFADTATPGTFVAANLYDAVEALAGRRFDLVYTGVGALCWIPEIRTWAQVVHKLLKPGGRLVVRDFHPGVLALEKREDSDRLELRYPYFETDSPMEFTDALTYAGTGKVANASCYEWNHGLGEMFTATLEAGLRIDRFEEFKHMCYAMFTHMLEVAPGKFELPPPEHERVPLMFRLVASRPPEPA